MKKTVFIVMVVMALVLAGWCFFADRDKGESDAAPVPGMRGGARGGQRPAVPVEVVPIRKGEIADIRVFTGTLLPGARYVVAPKVPGRLQKLAVEIGDALAPGQLIVHIDDEEYYQQVAQAQAIVEVAHATVEQHATAMALAQREMDRVRALRDKKIASEAEWDRVEADYRTQSARHKVALAQLAEKESALKSAEVRLAYTRISAPSDIMPDRWFVEERYVDEGAMLAANTPVASVVDILELKAVINVIERDYPLIRVGMPVTLETDAWPDTDFPGAVTRLAPALRESTRQARVEISVPNEHHQLRPGMFIRARIEFDRRANAVLIPAAALTKYQEVTGVFLIDRDTNRARFAPVTIGIQTPDVLEITEPEIDGLVATLGRHLLADGTMVVLPARGKAGPGKAAE